MTQVEKLIADCERLAVDGTIHDRDRLVYRRMARLLLNAVKADKRDSNKPKYTLPGLLDWVDEDPGTCPYCGESWVLVGPGKSQPTCDCQD